MWRSEVKHYSLLAENRTRLLKWHTDGACVWVFLLITSRCSLPSQWLYYSLRSPIMLLYWESHSILLLFLLSCLLNSVMQTQVLESGSDVKKKRLSSWGWAWLVLSNWIMGQLVSSTLLNQTFQKIAKINKDPEFSTKKNRCVQLNFEIMPINAAQDGAWKAWKCPPVVPSCSVMLV